MAVSKKWRLSSVEYYVDFLIVPAMLYASVRVSEISAPQLVVGVLIWSLIEYVLHRWLFHDRFRRDHWAHHVDPGGHVGISGFAVGIGIAAALPIAYAARVTGIYCGFLTGYFLYLLFHCAIHRPVLGLHWAIAPLVRNHESHHTNGVEKNFGVTSPLWDIVFGTYLAKSAN